jgi:hypothetical protein
MLTKPLQGELFKKFRACVLNLPATSPGWRSVLEYIPA